jgi:hypothetical protein
MPDITMCCGTRCDKKYECYRYMAVPNIYQSVASFADHDGECDNFLEIQGRDTIRDEKGDDK